MSMDNDEEIELSFPGAYSGKGQSWERKKIKERIAAVRPCAVGVSVAITDQ